MSVFSEYSVIFIIGFAIIATCIVDRLCIRRRHQVVIVPPDVNNENDLENILQQSLLTYQEEICITLESWGEKEAQQFTKYEKNMECPICMEIIEKEMKLYDIKCQHIFHKDCLQDAIKSNLLCPMCREKILKK